MRDYLKAESDVHLAGEAVDFVLSFHKDLDNFGACLSLPLPLLSTLHCAILSVKKCSVFELTSTVKSSGN